MLKHVIMCKLFEFTEGKNKAENVRNIEESVEKLVGIVPTIKSLQVGINQKISDMAYDTVLISLFKDANPLARYKSLFFKKDPVSSHISNFE